MATQTHQQYQNVPQHQQPQQYQQYQQYQNYQHYPQPQSHQQTQQSQQYYQNQQYGQVQQNSYNGYQSQPSNQPNPTQQYSHHQYGSHQPSAQGYPQPSYPVQGYPQQHTQQVYYNQQSPAFQYGTTPPQPQYQQSQHQQQHHQKFAHPSQADSQSCYNCGSPDHFAQVCPEPKRDVPVGDIDRQRRRSTNPQQPNTTAMTTFSGPPQGGKVPQSPQGYTPTQYTQTNYYPQNQSPYTTTPNSAQYPAPYNWQYQYPPTQQYQSFQQNQYVYQQNGYPTQSSPPRQQLYSNPANPTEYQYVGQVTNPVHQSPSQGSLPDPLHNAPYDNLPKSMQSSRSEAEPAASPPLSSLQQGNVHGTDSAHQNHGSSEKSSISMRSQTRSPQLGTDEDQETEVEEDDLSRLDVPDLSLSAREWGEKVVKPISLPIPSNYFVSETIWPIPPPASGSRGLCLSKYVRDIKIDLVMQNIKESNYWRELQEDTIFCEIPDEGDVVSVETCRSRIRERKRPKIDGEPTRKSRSQSRSMAPKQDMLEMASSLETVERALAEAKANYAEMIKNRKKMKKPDQSTRRQSQQQDLLKEEGPEIKAEHQSPPQAPFSDPLIKREQSAEDVLAALGVTGSPKPVAHLSRKTSHDSSSNAVRMQQMRSPRKADTYNMDSNPNAEQSSSNDLANGSTQCTQYYGYSVPPPFTKTAIVNSSLVDSPQVFPNGELAPCGYGQKVSENGNNRLNYRADGQAPSPIRRRSENSSSRKRSYDHRDSSSDEDESEGRRQEDDITPKYKRSQPKVAEAYSRRW